MNYRDKSLCRVRTVTLFLSLNKDRTSWNTALQCAKQEFDLLVPALQQKGYEVQSIRIVTNPFGEYLDLTDMDTAKADLAYLKQLLLQLNDSGLRIRFAIGEAKTAQEIEMLPELIADYGDLCNACVNVELDSNGILDNKVLLQSAKIVKRIAQITSRGEGNFNFTVNFNCKPFIPYFPAGYHRSELPNSFVIGFETPDLLVSVLKNIPKAEHNVFFEQCYQAMSQALQYHVDQVLDAIQSTALSGNFQFAGIDSSAAPSKNCASMTQVYELIGVPFFGASGTVEASSLLTKVFKSVKNVPLVGFSGLMLAVVEDTGLAQGTEKSQYDIRALLTYSAVCGIGLDTVPIPDNTTVEQIAALMRDTGTMAFRLNKPLTVRLFPIPGRQAEEMTYFESDDLCNSRILAVS
ncbi:DUF711 family protein [Glaesserella parasuis]|uniref:DUF711 family protein n=1 Tax=Glaesserella parasuis TaxID=738 RepID=A0A6M8T105_GLAPU|nr:DUF711 family protein [Glaesserella parasuis]MCT8824168.1 DUF711 family protein [Glaesserella parasuis]MDD2166000.1 DUF711 family protein [Glaesserella parasuis]MDD2167303.1 DUF711 family protein [Glaesserella parasuis]MDG6345411.1 DUF711 family protein [Glaesserella parasuis]MDG6409781.1 DUF711 family protein [Glaesserella parasuis]